MRLAEKNKYGHKLWILKEMNGEEQGEDVATYACRIGTIALVADGTFASDLTIDVTGEKTFC